MRRFALALALLSACGSPAPAPDRPAPEPRAEAAVEALNPDWEKIARDVARGRPVADQQAAYESDQHYRLALAYHDKGDFERAKVEAQKAVRLRPENLAARKLLAEILELVGGRGGGFGTRTAAQDEVTQARVKLDQAKIEITQHLLDGERYFNAKMYREALREFEGAEQKILHAPYEVKALNEQLPRVRDWARRSREATSEK